MNTAFATVIATKNPKNVWQRSIAATAITLSALLAGCATNLDMMQPGTVLLSGAQQVPVVDTVATGKGLFTVTSTKMISGGITIDRLLTATAAHIHLAPRGRNGPVIVPLTKTGDYTWSIVESTRLTDTQYVQYISGDFYVNVHSEAHPNGEIRGQLLAN
ncbi:MAG: CHRD domain-containing protein [Pseudomonadota bacterium]